MKAIRVIQLIWAALLVTLLFIELLAVNVVANGLLLLLAITYLFACIVIALGSNRVAWLIAVLVPVIFCARSLAMVTRDVVAFAKDDPLYLDSPATIYIVVVYALLFVFPSLILIVLFWRQRSALRDLLIPSAT